MKEHLNRRVLYLFPFIIMVFLMVYAPFTLIYSSSKSAYYSHIVLIPLVSIYLIYQKRKFIFVDQKYSFIIGIPLLLISSLLYFLGLMKNARFIPNDLASLMMLSSIIFINGAFILLYGSKTYRAALFPLLFLILIVPIPNFLMDQIINILQIGSSEVTNALFMASGVPFVRDGFVFHLPIVSVEVAKQCSGIMSCMALFITAVLAGHLFLETGWKKIVLAACIIPIAIFKNGVRIATLSLLANYVDPRILESSLHREGGIPFFIFALLLMAPILFFLRKGEKTGDE